MMWAAFMGTSEPGGASGLHAPRAPLAGASLGQAFTPAEAEELLRRLVADPYDQDALAAARRAGTKNPAALAKLLERVAAATRDGEIACHWLSHAEAIWSDTLGSPRNAARPIMAAIQRNPGERTAVQRLTLLSRGERDAAAVATMIEQRVTSLLLTAGRSSLAARVELAALYAVREGEGCAETYEKFCGVLGEVPEPAALEWAANLLRTERDPVALCDVLVIAASTNARTLEERKQSLRELAGIRRDDLGDKAGAIRAWKKLIALDRSDRQAREPLAALLEEARLWDDLCLLLERAAAAEVDVEKKIALQRRVATLHESERNDLAAAADALAFIANVAPTTEAILAAAAMFEKAEQPAQAAQVIANNVAALEEPAERAALLERLGQLRERLCDPVGAAEAYAGAAELVGSRSLWRAAERCFVARDAWEGAARTLVARAYGGGSPKERARHFARAAEYFDKVGDPEKSRLNLELAVDLDPSRGERTQRLADMYSASQDWRALVDLVESRGGEAVESATRVALRSQAAKVCRAPLEDRARSLAIWRRVLDDGDIQEALDPLIEDAVARGDREEAQALIERLVAIVSEGAQASAKAWREKLEPPRPDKDGDDGVDAASTEGEAKVAFEAEEPTAADETVEASTVAVDDDADFFDVTDDADVVTETDDRSETIDAAPHQADQTVESAPAALEAPEAPEAPPPPAPAEDAGRQRRSSPPPLPLPRG
jgi:hypothetical protein